MYNNELVNAYPSQMEVPALWDYRMTATLQSNRPWQVLILLEFNRLLVHGDYEALPEISWGMAIEIESKGCRMYIRPGAIDLVRHLLEETRKTCTLGIFTGLNVELALEMVKALFNETVVKQTEETEDKEWQTEKDSWPPSVVNKDRTVRVYIFHRRDQEILGKELSEIDMHRQPRWLYHDLNQVWEIMHAKGNNFTKQNTVLVGFKKEYNLCPDMVLSAEEWIYQYEDGIHMKSLRDRIASLFYQQPDHVMTWLKPGIQLHDI